MRPEIFEDLGVYSATDRPNCPPGFSAFPIRVLPAICFRWYYAGGGDCGRSGSARYEEEHGDKYLTQPGSLMPLGVHPRMAGAVADVAMPLVIVEGTKGHLAATSALEGQDWAVVGITGCDGWSHEGLPVPDFNAVPWAGRDVVISFDADRSTNRAVFDAAKMLTQVVHGPGCHLRPLRRRAGPRDRPASTTTWPSFRPERPAPRWPCWPRPPTRSAGRRPAATVPGPVLRRLRRAAGRDPRPAPPGAAPDGADR
jgi:hypothetical protein